MTDEPFFTGLFAAKAQQREAVHRALCGRPADTPTQADAPVASFDGGVRTTPPRPVTHEETLSLLFASRAADAGAHF